MYNTESIVYGPSVGRSVLDLCENVTFIRVKDYQIVTVVTIVTKVTVETLVILVTIMTIVTIGTVVTEVAIVTLVTVMKEKKTRLMIFGGKTKVCEKYCY